MSKKIKVVMVEPGKVARIEEIDNSLESMQSIVGGWIEAYYPFEEEVCIVCNDDGKINGMPLNRAIYTEDQEMMDIIAGPFFVCDCSGEEFDSLNDEQCQCYLEKFRYPEQFFRTSNGIAAIPYHPESN